MHIDFLLATLFFLGNLSFEIIIPSLSPNMVRFKEKINMVDVDGLEKKG